MENRGGGFAKESGGLGGHRSAAAVYGGRAMRQTELTFRNKWSRAIGVAGVVCEKLRRGLLKRIRRMKPAGKGTE